MPATLEREFSRAPSPMGAPATSRINGYTSTSPHRPEKIRLLLAYRHTLLRQALRLLLSTQEGIEVMEEAEDGKQVVEKADRMQPDVVLMDSALAIVDGLEATRLIKKKSSDIKVLLLTLGADDDYVVQLLRAGASGCLLKDADVKELATAIQAAHRGGSYLSPAIADRVVHNYVRLSSGAAPAPQRERLSVREREVLQLVAEGLTNQHIADRLVLSVKTVEAHKAHIMQKLNVHGRTELIKYAIRKGLIDLDR